MKFLITGITSLTLTLFAQVSPPAQTRPQNAPENRTIASKTTTRFTAIDIYIDSHEHPLAAYQFELLAKNADVKIVGVEGGDHAAFREPPYYDPAALSKNRIIIAAFNTSQDLPTGKPASPASIFR